MGVSSEESVVVCPVDPYVNDDYFEALKNLSEQADKGEANLVLMGIEPTYPSEKYGYIIPEGKEETSKVKTFKEKPTADVAKEYIAQGALWNGGVFAYKLKYVMGIAHKLIYFTDYEDLFNKYDTLTKISFDYGFNKDCSQDEVREAIKNGTLLDKLQIVNVKKNDVFFIEPGTVHAIGAGSLIAEIQESSNLTYRLYDYDRVDKQGKKRELHIDKALEVANLHSSAKPRQPMRVLKYEIGVARESLARCKYFEVYRMLLNTERRQVTVAPTTVVNPAST